MIVHSVNENSYFFAIGARACSATTSVSIVFVIAISTLSCSYATEFELFPGESFEAAVQLLKPGDTLTVHEGTYVDDGRVSINIKGDALRPVLIHGAAGEQRPLITRSVDSAVQNTINIEGSEYLTIRGFEITGNGGDGINMSANPSHITLDDLVIHDISVGINFRSNMHHITVRRNNIYATSDTGEGMYVGCNFATCVVSDSKIEYNWIHHTLASEQGDGIEIKRGSHSNLIRHNVIHDTNYPCILLYGTDGKPRNIVEGNVMWNCGNSGVQAAADSIIRNNIILQSPENGFNSQSHQGVQPANLEFVHNTIIGGDPCLRLSGWENRPGLIFANNAIYCAQGTYRVDGLAGVTILGNVLVPSTAEFPHGGYRAGRSAILDFQDVGRRNVYPSSESSLRGAGDASYATINDFNESRRPATRTDAGAYAWTVAKNPGWLPSPGIKNVAPDQR